MIVSGGSASADSWAATNLPGPSNANITIIGVPIFNVIPLRAARTPLSFMEASAVAGIRDGPEGTSE